MTRAELRRQILILLCIRQKTARRVNSVVADYHRAVVKRRFVVENIAEQLGLTLGIDNAGGLLFDNVPELGLPFDNDKRTGFAVVKSRARVSYAENGSVARRSVSRAFFHRLRKGAHLGAPHLFEDTPQLGLEHDYDRDDPDLQKVVDNKAHYL